MSDRSRNFRYHLVFPVQFSSLTKKLSSSFYQTRKKCLRTRIKCFLIHFLLSKKITPKKEVYLLPLDFWDFLSIICLVKIRSAFRA